MNENKNEYFIALRLLVEDLKEICQAYYERVYACEGQKWDLEREVRKRDYEVQYITLQSHPFD